MGVFFGTDGIRGVAGQELTTELAFSVGRSMCQLKKNPRILIARDTRRSGDALLLSFACGAVSNGACVTSIHIAPTPCVSFLVTRHKFDFGVVISASHNPAEYNGIKIFGSNGQKLADADETKIEKLLFRDCNYSEFGVFDVRPDMIGEYVSHLKASIGNVLLDGLKVVLDCANGASFAVAPRLFQDLGAKVELMSASNDGKNINNGCGALFVNALSEKVLASGADVGFAYDGDADRLIAVDEKGEEFDGDQILYFLAKKMKSESTLIPSKVVATIQTNTQIERILNDMGVEVLRSDVGDKYVIELMGKSGSILGGEQSGHIIVKSILETGDGILASLLIAKYLALGRLSLSKERAHNLIPQFSKNIIVQNKEKIMTSEILKAEKHKAQEMLTHGKIVLRASGTEPKIRIMIESNDEVLAKEIVDRLSVVIQHIDKFE